VRDFPASGRRRPARDPDPDLAVRAHDSGGRAVRSGAPDSRPRAVRSPGEAEYTHPLDAARASRRRAPPVPTRPAAAGSRSRSSARRQVAAAREAARAPSAAAVRPERRQLLATRDTGSARPARLRGGRRSGVHGHDGGDADVQSCSADGQGENSRITPRGVLASCCMRYVQSQRRGLERIGANVSRKCRTAAPWELERCRIWSDATGALPRSPAGADPSRGVRRTVLHGARRFVSPRATVEDGALVLPRVDARSVDAERCRTDGRNEYRQQSRFAQPTRGAANFVPGLRR